MPFSRPDAREWVTERVREINPKTICDVGPGSGTYWNLLHNEVDARWTGVEIFAPYVRQYRLNRKYDRLILADFMTADIPPHDLVILGDVLEHVPQDQAGEMLRRARVIGPTIVVVPIDEFEQGPSHGNCHEAHLWHPTPEIIEGFGPKVGWTNGRKGAWLFA